MTRLCPSTWPSPSTLGLAVRTSAPRKTRWDMMRSWNPREMTWNLIILIITSDISSWSSSAWSVSSELHHCIKHQKNVKHSDFFKFTTTWLHTDERTFQTHLEGPNCRRITDLILWRSHHRITATHSNDSNWHLLILVCLSSSFYQTWHLYGSIHRLDGRNHCRLAPWGSLHLRRRAWRLPPSSRWDEKDENDQNDENDEHQGHLISYDQRSNDTADVPGAWCHPSTTSVQHIPQTLPSSRRKEYLRCFESDGNIRFSRQFGLTRWDEFTLPNWFFEICLAFGVQHHLHKSPCLCKIYVLSARQEMRSKSLDVLMEQHIEKLSHLISVHSQCQENCL